MKSHYSHLRNLEIEVQRSQPTANRFQSWDLSLSLCLSEVGGQLRSGCLDLVSPGEKCGLSVGQQRQQPPWGEGVSHPQRRGPVGRRAVRVG